MVRRDDIREVFQRLRSNHDIYARMNYKDCQTCGSYAIGQDAPDDARGYVFFHWQDNDTLETSGYTYLAYGNFEDSDLSDEEVAEIIVREFQRQGVHTEWDGDSSTRVLIGFKNCYQFGCDRRGINTVRSEGGRMIHCCDEHLDEAKNEFGAGGGDLGGGTSHHNKKKKKKMH